MSVLLEIKDLCFRYPNTNNLIIDKLNLEIPERKITVIAGPSGCGKSTIALSLAGIIPNSIEGFMTGDIMLKGEQSRGRLPGQICKDIGVLFQDPESQFCSFTVEDELAFTLENLRYDRAKMSARIDELLGMFELSSLRKRLIHTLSGGEKQKVAICALLALDPGCLVLDEPTANLDPKSTEEVFKLLEYICKDMGKTVVLIEHKMDEVLRIADNIIILSSSGQVEFSGNQDELAGYAARTKGTPVWMPELLSLSRRLKSIGAVANTFLTQEQALTELKDCFSDTIHHNGVKAIQDNHNIVSLRELSFAYNPSEPVLNRVNIDIQQGEFIAIVGPNGAGKSTLTKILLGLYKKYSGQALIEDMQARDYTRKELAKKVGLVFQNPEHQFVANTVCGELEYSLQLRNGKHGVDKSKINEYIRLFNLKGLEECNPFQLSQGQKRRLSVASMLINGQDILILDEPTFGQDKENIIMLMEYMKKLNEDGVTIIMITHDMSVVSSYCKRAIVMEKGNITFDGTTREMFSSHKIIEKANLQVPPIVKLSANLRKADNRQHIFMNADELVGGISGYVPSEE